MKKFFIFLLSVILLFYIALDNAHFDILYYHTFYIPLELAYIYNVFYDGLLLYSNAITYFYLVMRGIPALGLEPNARDNHIKGISCTFNKKSTFNYPIVTAD